MNISVNCKPLELHVSGFTYFIDGMKEFSEQIAAEGKKINAMGIRMAPINARLGRVRSDIQANCDSLQQLRTALECAVTEYRATELRLCKAGRQKDAAVSLPAYLTLNEVESVFSTFNFWTYFVDNLNGLSVFGYFFSHFDDNMKALINSCGGPVEFVRRLMDGTLPQHVADEYINDKDKVKGLLSGVLEEMFDNKVDLSYDSTTIKTIKALDTLTDCPAAHAVRDILEKGYDLDKKLGKAADLAEKVGYLVTDYSNNVELLESLKEIAPNNEALNEIIDEVLFDYKNRFNALLRDEVADKIEDFAQKSLDEITGANFKLVNTVIKGTIGQAPVMDGIDTVIHISGLKQGAIRTYQAAVETIKNGVYSAADEQAYINSFNLCKELTLKEYRAMLSCYDDPFSKEYMYLDSQISILEGMSYDNTVVSTSFKDFVGKHLSSEAGGGGGGRFGGGF